jgi:selenide,water dikinase
LAKEPAVHAITDVTGFGLLGHALEMARGAKVTLVVRFDDLPLLSEAIALAGGNFITGASKRNWASYSESVILPTDFPEWRRDLLTDPQTSGGLLIACEQDKAIEVARMIADQGYPSVRVIGRVEAGPPSVAVESCRG